jgi:tether containing UBX domain for GLUT4
MTHFAFLFLLILCRQSPMNTVEVQYGTQRIVVRTTPTMNMSSIIDNVFEKITGKKPERSTLALQCHDVRTSAWTDLPPSETVRFAGLTNRAKLKLVARVPQHKRAHSKAPEQPAAVPAEAAPVPPAAATSDVVAASTPDPMDTDERPVEAAPTPAPEVSNSLAPAADVEHRGARSRSKSPKGRAKAPAGHPVDRMVSVYRPGQSKGPIVIPEVPDSFYDLSTSDVKAMASSTRKAVAASSDAPLMTKEMRDRAEARAMAKRGPTTRLRLRFQDRWEVEATFLNNEKVGDVLDFIRHGGYLPTPPPASMHCFVTPPKVELRETMTLSKHNLCPSALVYVWYDGWPSSHACLAEEVRATAKDREVPQVATPVAPPAATSTDAAAAPASSSSSASAAAPIPSSAVRGTAPEAKSSKIPGVPKWLKL